MKSIYPNAKLSYNINKVRQKIVDSWPDNINDSLATKEWGWKPNYKMSQLKLFSCVGTINEQIENILSNELKNII